MAVNIANVLAEDGHDVMLVVSRKSGGLEEFISPKVQVAVLQKRTFWDAVAFFRFIRILRKFKPDVVHAHSSSVIWAGLMKLIFNKLLLIWHDHNGERIKNSIFKNSPYILISPFINSIISVNDLMREWSLNYMRVDKNKIKYLPNFPFLHPSKDQNRNQERVLLNIANLREPKDHLNLLKAFKILLSKIEEGEQSIKLTLVGRYNQDSSYYKEVVNLIHDLNLEEKVGLVGESNQVEKFLYNSEIGIISSKSEGLPVSLLEYGLAALPVVVTDVGQCAAVVGHGQFGKVVPPQTPEAMANALVELINRPQEAKKYGHAFKKHVEENYGAGKFLKEYYQLIGA